MKYVFIGFLAVHALLHLLGFAKAFGLAEMKALRQTISKPVGSLWLLDSLLLVATALAYLTYADWWWMLALGAALLSQFLVMLAWFDAKWGTLPNLILIAAAAVGFAQ